MTPEQLAAAFDEVERWQLVQGYIARQQWIAKLTAAHIVNTYAEAMNRGRNRTQANWVSADEMMKKIGMAV